MTWDPEHTKLDPRYALPLQPVYIEWRDHVGYSGHTSETKFPIIVFAGFVNLIEETEDTYVIAAFVGRDEFALFDVTAILKESVVRFVRFPLPAESVLQPVEPADEFSAEAADLIG